MDVNTYNECVGDAVKGRDYLSVVHPARPTESLEPQNATESSSRSQPVQQEGCHQCLQDRATGNPNQVPANRVPTADAGGGAPTATPAFETSAILSES